MCKLLFISILIIGVNFYSLVFIFLLFPRNLWTWYYFWNKLFPFHLVRNMVSKLCSYTYRLLRIMKISMLNQISYNCVIYFYTLTRQSAYALVISNITTLSFVSFNGENLPQTNSYTILRCSNGDFIGSVYAIVVIS